jgi:hypothetical protein
MKVLVRFYGFWRPVIPRLVRLPVNPGCLLDIVPVDYVARAVTTLFGTEGAAGRAFHLAAGQEAATIEQLVNSACDHFGVARLGYIKPHGLLSRAGRMSRPLVQRVAPRLMRNGELILAYARQNPRFDTSAASGAGLRPPHIETYFTRLISYAYASDFGGER